MDLLPLDGSLPGEKLASPAILVSKCSVTSEQFVKLMNRSPANATRDWRVSGAPDAPATDVTWDEAVGFCRALSALKSEAERDRLYRLPTITEWERFHQQHSKNSDCFAYDRRPLHWAVWEWCSDSFGGQANRLWWSHPDPFLEAQTFRVVCESGKR